MDTKVEAFGRSVLGGSWYLSTNYSGTYNHIRVLQEAYKWVISTVKIG